MLTEQVSTFWGRHIEILPFSAESMRAADLNAWTATPAEMDGGFGGVDRRLE